MTVSSPLPLSLLRNPKAMPFTAGVGAAALAISLFALLNAPAPEGIAANESPPAAAPYVPPPAACGNCGALCREAAFDRVADKPDSLIACARLRTGSGVGVAVLRSAQIPQLWVVTEDVLIRADHPVFDQAGRDLRSAVLQDSTERWPWLWDRLALPPGGGAAPPAAAAGPSPAAPAELPAAAGPPSLWMALATAEAMRGPLAGLTGDFREFAPDEFNAFVEWIEISWPGPEWRRMAWIDPQCPHCKDLVERGVIDHYAPRVIMRPREAEARAAAGWLLADPPQLNRFLAFEPADEDLSRQALEHQRVLDQLLWELRRDWGVVVPVQALRGDGWIVFWWGAEEPPQAFTDRLPPAVAENGAT